MECWNTGMLGMGPPGSLIIPPFHYSSLLFPAHRRIPTERVSTGGSAFLIPASSACARSLLVPGTCDLTRRRADASDSAAPCAWKGPTTPAP